HALAAALRRAAAAPGDSGQRWLLRLSPRGAPRHTPRHGAFTGTVPHCGGAAHAAYSSGTARLPAAALQPAAAHRRSLHARPALGWTAGTGRRPRRHAL